MEPMNDDELNRALREWQAPSAPAGLERRILARTRSKPTLLRWVMTGSMRVPVPVVLCLVAILLVLTFRQPKPPVSDLSDFQQVKEFKPRVVRTTHATNE